MFLGTNPLNHGFVLRFPRKQTTRLFSSAMWPAASRTACAADEFWDRNQPYVALTRQNMVVLTITKKPMWLTNTNLNLKGC